MNPEVVDKIMLPITTATGMIAALSWNEAIKSLLGELGLPRLGPFIYAAIVTVLAVIVTIWLSRLAKKAKKINVRKKLKSTAKRLDLFA